MNCVNWPYAAKPTLQHEFDTDHINIWLTFPRAMNQTVKPANSKWTAFLDNVEKNISSSEWLDAYTLLIVIAAVVSLPDRVLLSYTGPGPTVWDPTDPLRETLEISYKKQYEPFEKILSLNITT